MLHGSVSTPVLFTIINVTKLAADGMLREMLHTNDLILLSTIV